MIKKMVEAFVDAKRGRRNVRGALSRRDRRGSPRIDQTGQSAVAESRLRQRQLSSRIDTMLSAMAGAMRSLLEVGSSPATVRKARE
jgi:hypothetical protein